MLLLEHSPLTSIVGQNALHVAEVCYLQGDEFVCLTHLKYQMKGLIIVIQIRFSPGLHFVNLLAIEHDVLFSNDTGILGKRNYIPSHFLSLRICHSLTF